MTGEASRVPLFVYALLVCTLLLVAFVAGCSPSGAHRDGPVPLPDPAASLPATIPPDGTPKAITSPRERRTEPEAECPDDNETRSWYYTASSAPDGVPSVPAEVARMLDTYRGLWRADTSEKVVYLTFDEGYEAGFTPAILDTLARERVPAAFFVTRSYIENNPQLVRRMVADGHIVANHSDTHPSMPTLAGDPAAFEAELARCAEAFEALTGERMASYFRPPMGEYSARALCMTERLGYTSVFWSFAHRDWLLDDQPPASVTVERVVRGTHPGAILLLHAVSASNTEALPEIIGQVRSAGYRFGALYEIDP